MNMKPPSFEEELFEEACGSKFSTPLWHWTLTWRENRYLNVPAKIIVGALTKILSIPIELPHGFSLAEAWTWKSLSAKTELEQKILWLQAFPRHTPKPIEWLNLAKGFNEPFAIRMHCHSEKSLAFCLLLVADKEPLAYAAREVDLENGEVNHSYFVVAPGKKGSGIAKKLIKNAVIFYKRIQVTKIFLTAGLSAGGAVWAKFGFRPIDSNAWRGIKHTIRDNAKKTNPIIQNIFIKHRSLDLISFVDQIIENDDPRRIWDLVDIDFDNSIASESHIGKGGLSGLLLQNTRWEGVLDFQDSEAADRLNLYLSQEVRLN